MVPASELPLKLTSMVTVCEPSVTLPVTWTLVADRAAAATWGMSFADVLPPPDLPLPDVNPHAASARPATRAHAGAPNRNMRMITTAFRYAGSQPGTSGPPGQATVGAWPTHAS